MKQKSYDFSHFLSDVQRIENEIGQRKSIVSRLISNFISQQHKIHFAFKLMVIFTDLCENTLVYGRLMFRYIC